MSIVFNEQADEISKLLTKYRILSLYHFTAIDNLSIIAKCAGLWSKQKSEQAGLLDGGIITGGNELSLSLDRRYANWDKVHLYFCPNTPMAYRVQQNFGSRDPQSAHICYLIIDPAVAMWKGVYFTDTNATGYSHKREQGLDGLRLIDFGTIGAHLSRRWIEPKQRWHTNVQAECLVPNEIPLKYIKSISFISDASLKEGKRLWGSGDHPPFSVNEKLFHRGFPFVTSFCKTSKHITRETVDALQFRNEDVFSTRSTMAVTLFVNLQATPGTQALVIWRNSQDEIVSKNEAEFEKENSYRHWPSLTIAGLEEGYYSVEYCLNTTRWFKTYFRIRG